MQGDGNAVGGSRPSSAPFEILEVPGWARFAFGYGALWLILSAMVDAGAGKVAVQLGLLTAGAATAVSIERVTANLGIGGAK